MMDILIDRYRRSVADMVASLPLDDAMSSAVGGDFDLVGNTEMNLLVGSGLQPTSTVVDLGCGSGRLAIKLAQNFPRLNYTGTDVIQPLLDYAARHCPPHWRFVMQEKPDIPVPSASADFIVAFSLFTHVFYEYTFAFLRAAKRALKPNGLLIFSFLEPEKNWPVFEWSMSQIDMPNAPLNVFMERSTVETFCRHLGFKIDHYADMGQTAAILRLA